MAITIQGAGGKKEVGNAQPDFKQGKKESKENITI